MSTKPIFLATHPRSCSTAFERLFVSRANDISCIHEPFTEGPYHWGLERIGERFANNEDHIAHRKRWGLGNDCSYKMVMERIRRRHAKGKRVFTKEMAYGLIPPHGKPSSIAPSLLLPEQQDMVESQVPETYARLINKLESSNGSHSLYPYFPHVVEPFNPTVLPEATLKEFHFTFLIRDPLLSVPSLYRLTIPPASHVTGWHFFSPDEASYSPLRRLFDYLCRVGQIGPRICGRPTDERFNFDFPTPDVNECENLEICVVDADDLLRDPVGVLKQYCGSIGIRYDPSMLMWDDPDNRRRAEVAFQKFKGFHEEALNSTSLRPQTRAYDSLSFEEASAQWIQEFGIEAAKIIGDTVEKNVADYEYLKSFAIKPYQS